ncbi:MAG TPA: M50 family metallopeptidase [Longimicrobiales bacterium]
MGSKARRRIGALAVFTVYFVALWLLWDTPVVYPLKVFVVLVHELAHAAAVLATGGTVERIVLTADQAGAAYTRGGNAFVTLSAGYLGSLLFGLVLLGVARARAAYARVVVAALGALLIAVAVIYMRSGFGLVFSLVFGAALLLAARWVHAAGLSALLTTLGLTSALYAVLDIRSDVLQRPLVESDAALLAQMTGVPALAWGIAWMAVALTACGWALRRAWDRA